MTSRSATAVQADREVAPGALYGQIVALEERRDFLAQRIAGDEADGKAAGYKHRERGALEVAIDLMYGELARRAEVWRRVHPKRERQPWEARMAERAGR